jgi:dihydroxyacetone kinase
MRFRLSSAYAALVAATLMLAATPVSAKTTESQENSNSAFTAFASQLKAQSEQALAASAKAAANAIAESKAAIAEAEKNLAPRFETFRLTLNEQKARLGIIGQDAASRLKAWTEAAAKAWDEKWSDSWAHSWTEFHRSAMETLDRFRDWIAKQSVSDDQTETPV